MTFRFIDEVIRSYVFNFEALEPNTDLYTTLLFQHTGIFFATPHKFGNRDDASEEFNAFLRLAKRERSSIAITPEYSCPWNSIRWILDSLDNQPSDNKLWVLGCESITPAELRLIREQYQNDNILIHFDDGALDRGVNVLLNPLCYVFKALDSETSETKLVVIVQFKTEHMGVWTNDIEQEHYIPGEEIYVLRNGLGSIALFTLICSETDNFQISENFKQQLEYRWDGNSFIIVNIQMNPQPSALFFKNFRAGVMEYENKDIITLNWSSQSKKANGQSILTYSKSSVAYRSHQMDFTDGGKIATNHTLGLYYANWQQDRHVYFLNGNQQVFLIAHRKPISGGQNPSMHRRTGPVARKIFSWDAVSASFIQNATVDDGFLTFLNQHNCNSTALRDPEISFIDKERLINISTGLVKCKSLDRVWHTIDKLNTFFLEDDEVIRRLTFVQDEAGERRRQEYLETIDMINSEILPNAECFPPNHVVFIGKCDEIMFIGSGADKYRFNLITNDGAQRATAAYIGRNTLVNAERTLRKLWELFDEGDQARKRVIVWYKPNVRTIVPVCDSRKPTISDDSKSKSNSISKQS